MNTENVNDKEVIESKPAKKKNKNKDWQTKKCKVLTYSKISKTLGILFDGYGVEIHGVTDYEGCSDIVVKYKGKIGTPDFEVRL